MQRIVRLAIKSLAVVVLALLLIAAVIWPWPAPDVDWRTPLDAALAKNDCFAAASILDAAADAGSPEAYKRRVEIAANTTCYKNWRVHARDDYALFLAYEARRNGYFSMIAAAYGLDEYDLGTWRNIYVMGTLIICAAPYDSSISVDNAELAKTVVKHPSFLMRLHQRRREICTGVMRQLAAQLIDTADFASRAVAFGILTDDPLLEDTESELLLAKLVFEHGFVRYAAGTRTTESLKSGEFERSIAWENLKALAQNGNEIAIRMMITVLHEGRLMQRDNKELYFWLLRLRRHGKTSEPITAEIEGELTDAERKEVAEREEFMYIAPRPR